MRIVYHSCGVFDSFSRISLILCGSFESSFRAIGDEFYFIYVESQLCFCFTVVWEMRFIIFGIIGRAGGFWKEVCSELLNIPSKYTLCWVQKFIESLIEGVVFIELMRNFVEDFVYIDWLLILKWDLYWFSKFDKNLKNITKILMKNKSK